jgi:tRNA pseudouridine55 synthase
MPSTTQYFQQNVWLNIDKPKDYSSAKVVSIVKKITKAKKVGHAGTLDPFATGVLPIAINKATKTCSYIENAIKKYYFEISWGEFRDSDDITGNIIKSSPLRPKIEDIIAVLPKFIGIINQTPSKFSAIKINGTRSYKLARQGLDFEIKVRQIKIIKIKLIFNNTQKAGLEVVCSKGTYIRSLAKDLANTMGVCGYVSLLKRLQVGNFLAINTISLAKLKNIVKYHSLINILLQLRDVLNFIPEIELTNLDALKIKNGQFVKLDNNKINIKPADASTLQNSSQNTLAIKVINQGALISLASLNDSLLKPFNNF